MQYKNIFKRLLGLLFGIIITLGILIFAPIMLLYIPLSWIIVGDIYIPDFLSDFIDYTQDLLES